MKKKFLSGMLALWLAVGILPACTFPTVGGDVESSSKESSVEDNSSGDLPEEQPKPPEDIVTAEMSIHFLYLGNATPGDCTLIKVGDTEVLIDAGSTTGSVTTIIPYIQQYCTDGVLEYVVATHAHEDHIAGFVGGSKGKGIFESFVCETIIDYTAKVTNSDISAEYEEARDKEVATHNGKHYTALECWNNENGAQRSYPLGDGITMNILYQKYYETKTTAENNYSVCLMISQDDNHYLFTGDLESAGEKSLVAENDLPKCKLYKGGHHGSETSSSPELLAKIQPQIVCVCTCCGETKYKKFPTQQFINNIAPYTDKVYMTTVRTSTGKGIPLNGNIAVVCNGDDVKVKCTNNNILFKDTDWFKNNRTCPEAWKTVTTGA